MDSNNLKNRDNQQGQIEEFIIWLNKRLERFIPYNNRLFIKNDVKVKLKELFNKPSEATKEQPNNENKRFKKYIAKDYYCVSSTKTCTRGKIYSGYVEEHFTGFYGNKVIKLFHFIDDRGIHNTASPKRFKFLG